jgi:hypothetical protein
MDNDFDKHDEILSKAIKNALKEDIESLDYFKDIKYVEPNFKDYKDRRHFFSVKNLSLAVAAVLIIIMASGFLSMSILNGTVNASKFRIEQQLTIIKNNLTQSDDFQVGDDYISLKIDNMDQIGKAQEYFPKLFIPENIPERFQFQSLEVKQTANGIYYASYLYLDKNGLSMSVNQETIREQSSYSISIVNVTKELKTKEGTIYLSENPFGDGANASSYLKETEIIDIGGFLSIEEILKIYQ